ncbi:MAG: tyrosine-type recombinase/integrase [Paracoccaceae bacterium]|nr:tyrosine-type recombinase/integrase [Paracoccaceae bacterium]
MDETVLKLPKYVFRRPNGSYRYKRNVPKVLQKYIYKKTLYRQLGATYTEAIANLPRVHRQIEHLFQIERLTHPEERAATLIEANLGEVWLDAAKMGMVGQEHNVLPIDAYVDLADELELTTLLPTNVINLVRRAKIDKPPMTLERVFFIYARDKAKSQTQVQRLSLEQRIERLRKDIKACFGADLWAHRELKEYTRRDATALRDYLLGRMSPSSVQRAINIVKAGINHVIREEELEDKNPFAFLSVEGSAASKEDRLPLSEEDMARLTGAFESSDVALALFVTLADTGARLAEIVGLEVIDLDKQNSSIWIRPNSHRSLKTKNSARLIPLSPRALTLLAPLTEGQDGTDPIFPAYSKPRGNDLASAMLMKRLRKVVADKKKTIHSLRHRMKDRLRNSDCPEPLSLAILGHSRNTIAENYGSGYSLEKMREAMTRAWLT